MCEACEVGAPGQRGIGTALAARARAIEAAKPGIRVAEECWAIVLGQRGGALAWADHARILACLDQAGAELAARRGRSPRGAFRCDAAA